VIAQAVVDFADGSLAWELAALSAADRATDVPADGDPGFLLGADEPTLVSDAAGGARTRLEGGEALAVRPDDELTVQAAAENPATLTLLTLGTVEGSQTDTGRRQSEAFDSPGGSCDVDLVRDVLIAGELTTLAAGQAPTYVLVTEGAIGLETDDGEIQLLTAGESALLVGELVVIGAGEVAASFVAAVIGADVDAVATTEATSTTAEP
jgi:hypothetical protein